MLVQLLVALLALVVAGILLGVTGLWPLELLGSAAFMLGAAGLTVVVLLAALALAKGALFGEGSRWRRFN
ncbi:MAG TPA: hypothetical protein VM582_10295 [Candidatus Thermoplasmatota archaeon]|nr:hypothetical protein [Candidatus Thermoplasmatota archaeon]